MGKIVLIKKDHLGSGNYEYTYSCTCNNSSNEIKVTSGNDSQAEMLAQMECDEICNETQMTKQEISDSKTILEESGKNYESSFIVSVDNISKDSYAVYLCTGDKVTVPKNVIKTFELIGVLQNGKSLHQIAQLSFDTISDNGFLAEQLSNIIEKLSVSSGDNITNTVVNKEGEQHLQIKVPCTGRACNPTHSYYTSKKPIIQYSLRKVEGCIVNNVTKIGSYKLRVLHSALGGTICGTNYSGRAYFDIVVRTN